MRAAGVARFAALIDPPDVRLVPAPPSLPSLPALARLAALVAFGSLAACGCAEPPPERGSGAAPPPAEAASWSRSGAAAASAQAGAPLPSMSVDRSALADLVAAAPKRAALPTGADGDTLVGTETGAQASRSGAPPPAPSAATPAPSSVVGVGDAFLEPGMSSPAIERAARAQIYWTLVHRCRDSEGKVLPPDAIRLEFTIESDGSIATSTILATSEGSRHEEAAQCMRRELAAAEFRAPGPRQGMATRITMTVPSVD